jgi:hypothetical protein
MSLMGIALFVVLDGGLIFGPLILLVLYVRRLYQAKAEGKAAAKTF